MTDKTKTNKNKKKTKTNKQIYLDDVSYYRLIYSFAKVFWRNNNATNNLDDKNK
jgi:hypothetical protein